MLDLTENVDEKVSFDHLKPEFNISVNRPFFFIVEMDHDVLALGRIKDPNWFVNLYTFKKDQLSFANPLTLLWRPLLYLRAV